MSVKNGIMGNKAKEIVNSQEHWRDSEKFMKNIEKNMMINSRNPQKKLKMKLFLLNIQTSKRRKLLSYLRKNYTLLQS